VGNDGFDIYVVLDVFLLLLIGIGPKIALVPFVELTAGLDPDLQRRVTRKMLTTAATVGVALLLLGELLSRLLHFSTGALSVAGGVVLLVLAVTMVLGQGDPVIAHATEQEREPMRMAVFPLAVPYLLNPAGIVVLVTLSAEAGSVGHLGLVAVLLAAVLLIDVIVFRWADRISGHLDPSRMLVTEKIFGFLLAALAVQLALNGLADEGVIQLNAH
jgi:multiple antibiotic resistance protein